VRQYRSAIYEFNRKPLAEITTVQGADDLLEPVRLAPSAMNNQPWYITGTPEKMDVWQRKRLLPHTLGQIDMGIALSHLYIAAGKQDRAVRFFHDPQAEGAGRGGLAYVTSAQIDPKKA
jgi:hypothetical protein